MKPRKAPKPAPMLERHVKTLVTNWLRLYGWRVHRLQAGQAEWPGGGRTKLEGKDTPDLLAVRVTASGRTEAMYVELKAPGKKPRLGQTAWAEHARLEGLTVVWADGLDRLQSQMVLSGVSLLPRNQA